jgi:hypothetical protein
MKMSLTAWQIWRVPILLGIVSAVGMAVALLFEGIGHVISWMSLTVPIITVLWFSVR